MTEQERKHGEWLEGREEGSETRGGGRKEEGNVGVRRQTKNGGAWVREATVEMERNE